MSREIEFRAWHEDAKEYCKGSVSNMFKWVEDGQPVFLEQFTGLLDCNGVKIFEGDLLNFREPLDYKPMIAEFKDGAFRVAIGRWVMVLDELYVKSNELVVVGNIHQHPELLP